MGINLIVVVVTWKALAIRLSNEFMAVISNKVTIPIVGAHCVGILKKSANSSAK